MKKFLIIGFLAVALLAAGAYFFPSYPSAPAQVPTIDTEIGASPGSRLNYPEVRINNFPLAANVVNMLKATTTPCAIKSPNATSTLLLGSVDFSTSSTTATTVSIAKATTAFATTTNIGTLTLAANERGTWFGGVASSSATNVVFPPNNYFVVGMQGGVGGLNFSPVGTCQALFIPVQ